MGIERKNCLPTFPAPVEKMVRRDGERQRRIIAMKDSLVEMFGDAALSVARGQPQTSDVAGRSGIRWQEIAQALHQV